jgi:hypothetical protein
MVDELANSTMQPFKNRRPHKYILQRKIMKHLKLYGGVLEVVPKRTRPKLRNHKMHHTIDPPPAIVCMGIEAYQGIELACGEATAVTMQI